MAHGQISHGGLIAAVRRDASNYIAAFGGAKMSFRNQLVFSFICLIVVFAGAAHAQVTTGRISGAVTDPNGAVVPNAAVKVTNLDTNASLQTKTSEDGNFAFQLLPPGRYRVEVATQGFQNYQAEAVVNITQTTTVNAQLSVTGAAVSVTIEPEAPVLQTDTSQNGRVIEGETIR